MARHGMDCRIAFRVAYAVPRVFEKIRLSIGSTWRAVVYFGLIWLALGMAPILVSGYYSPRHMYLASLGWAVVLGAALEMLWYGAPAITRRFLAVVFAGRCCSATARSCTASCGSGTSTPAISRAAVVQIEQEAASDPDGTLVIAGVPRLSWAFAVPHAVRPPFTTTDSRSGSSSSPIHSITAAMPCCGTSTREARCGRGTTGRTIRRWWPCTGIPGQDGCRACRIATILSCGRWRRY